jgi:hypothetical protein
MICDTVESATRANMPDNPDKLEALLDKLIYEKVSERQFDECDISLKDIKTIKDTLLDILPNMHHTRIVYPEAEAPTPILPAPVNAEEKKADKK